MKTTIELSDSVFTEIKQCSKEMGIPMRELFETALRKYLQSLKQEKVQYQYENHPFKGQGVCAGVQEGNWEYIRSNIYKGRGE